MLYRIVVVLGTMYVEAAALSGLVVANRKSYRDGGSMEIKDRYRNMVKEARHLREEMIGAGWIY